MLYLNMENNILTKTKMKVTPRQSKIIQEFAFKLGYMWIWGGKTIQNNMFYIEFTENSMISSFPTKDHFENSTNKLITFEEIMGNKETIITVLGQETEPKKELKPIEFIKFLGGSHIVCEVDKSHHVPKLYKEIVLLDTNYDFKGFDLMFAIHSDKPLNCLFLGHFNDGVV